MIPNNWDIDEYTQIIHNDCELPVEICACSDWPVREIAPGLFEINMKEAYLRNIE